MWTTASDAELDLNVQKEVAGFHGIAKVDRLSVVIN